MNRVIVVDGIFTWKIGKLRYIETISILISTNSNVIFYCNSFFSKEQQYSFQKKQFFSITPKIKIFHKKYKTTFQNITYINSINNF